MWSEEIDKKIRAAAENDVHGYEDKSWQNMEVLLEKHLPQKKRQRGVIVFFLLASLAISGYLLINSISSSNKKTLSQQKNTTVPESTPENKQTRNSVPVTSGNAKNVKTHEKINAEENTPPVEVITNAGKLSNTILSANDNSSVPVTQTKTKNPVVAKNLSETSAFQPATNKSKNKKPPTELIKNTHPVIETAVATNTIPETTLKNTPSNSDKQKSIPASPEMVADKATTEQPAIAIADAKKEADPAAPASNDAVKKEQKNKSRGNKISFNFSFGPDLSSVGINNPGRVKAQYGVGIGYAISDKFSVRAGFYAGRKIYSADSSSYHTPYTSGLYSFKLHKIDANCLVYEIPVSVVYNFAKAKNHNWFTSAGLSSYIMKDEWYKYTYKNMSGQQMSYAYDYRNDNSHFLSVLNLSGGYQYNISKRFSLLAEPYIKLPLSGVGEGRVRLNSAGVLFTASLRPFAR